MKPKWERESSYHLIIGIMIIILISLLNLNFLALPGGYDNGARYPQTTLMITREIVKGCQLLEKEDYILACSESSHDLLPFPNPPFFFVLTVKLKIK